MKSTLLARRHSQIVANTSPVLAMYDRLSTIFDQEVISVDIICYSLFI